MQFCLANKQLKKNALNQRIKLILRIQKEVAIASVNKYNAYLPLNIQ